MYDYTQPTCNNFSKSLLGYKKGQNCSFMLIYSFAKFLTRPLGNWAGGGQSESFLTGQLCNHESQGDIYSLIIVFQDTAVK